jgi:spore coat protein A
VQYRGLSRRALLRGGAGVAAGAAIAPVAWRLRGCGEGDASVVDASPPPGASGTACASPVRSVARADPAGPPRAPLHPDALEPFVDPLPLPPVLTPVAHEDGAPRYRVAMREAEVRVHRDLPPTRMWTYEGAMPGPTIEARSGQGMIVEWVNVLPERHLLPIDHTLHGAGADLPEARAVVHVHGAKAPPESDGYPEDWITPGRSIVARYPVRQDAATLWYHDHAMGLERLNQYAGLLGCFFVRDAAEDALDLPRGDREIPLVVTDRMLFADGQLRYPTSTDPAAPWVSEVYGDAPLVNGKLRPYLDVAPEAYRLRIVNASNARVFALSLSDGRVMQQIGTDQGLLPAPVPLRRITLAPAERADLVVDLNDAAGRSLVLRNGTVPLLQLRVASSSPGSRPRARRVLPPVLRPSPRLSAADATTTRTLTLAEYHDAARGRMLMLLDGKRWHEPVSVRPALGSVEVWRLVNTTEDMHPIHLHLVRFLVLDRQPFDSDAYGTSGRLETLGPPVSPEADETGWKDTVRAQPGMITRIVARFDGWRGRYVWHCHVLEHAANEMMRPFEVV